MFYSTCWFEGSDRWGGGRRGSAASEKTFENEPVRVIGNLGVRVHQRTRKNDNEQRVAGYKGIMGGVTAGGISSPLQERQIEWS